jgi:hypothetical protein
MRAPGASVLVFCASGHRLGSFPRNRHRRVGINTHSLHEKEPITMDKIRELLGRLNTLTADELTELKTAVIEEADKLLDEPTTPETVSILTELAESSTTITSEEGARAEAQAAAEQAKQAAADAIKTLRGEDPEAEADAEVEGEPAEAEPVAAVEGDEEDEDEKDKEPSAEEVAEPVAVAASGVAAVAAAKPSRRATPSPEAAKPESGRSRVLVASAYGGFEETQDRFRVAEAMCDRLGRMNRRGAPQGVALVASAEWDYPDERDLRKLDANAAGEKMDASTGLSAVLATGGICLPVNVDYAIPTWATAERPLKEGLPSYQATRGGLRFVQPPDIGGLAAATGIWTEATDAEPLAATKPVFSVACGTEELVYVAAVSTRIGFGNMQSRFQPEMVAANTDLAIAAAARVAELRLLELIQGYCVADVTSAKVLGATRDLITAITQAVTAFRYAHRLPDSLQLTGVFPNWLKGLIRIDRAREIGHGQDASLMVTDQEVEAIIKACGVNPIFTIDSLPEPESEAFPTQQFAIQASGAIEAFPAKLMWNLFPEGTMQFLDGGRLDLGVVRDSTLDATNDYETFVETFEGLANRGFAKAAIQYVTELCANGKTGATETVSTCA